MSDLDTVAYQARQIRRQANRIAYLCKLLEGDPGGNQQAKLSEISVCATVIHARVSNVRER